MKYLKYNLFLFIISIFTLISCEDDKEQTLEKTDTLKIQTSENFLQLDETKNNDIAITFSWNNELDLKSGQNVTYIFRLGLSGKNFSVSTSPEIIPGDVNTKSFTHKELNELVTEDWLISPGKNVTLEARISAKISSDIYVKPEYSVTSFGVKCYEVSPCPLYLIGNAIPGVNWNLSSAIQINEAIANKIYYWKGNVEAGTFKFVFSRESDLPSLNKGNNEQSIIERTDASQADNRFTINKSGLYAMMIDKKNMTIIHENVIYEKLWMIGSASPVGWGGINGGGDNIANSLELTWDPLNPNTFYFEGELKAGEFKLPLTISKGWDCPYLMPVHNGSGPKGDNNIKYSATGHPDDKWAITADEAGKYRVTINTKTMKINFKALD